MGKAKPIPTPPPGGNTDPVEDGDVQVTVPPAGDRPDPFIRGLGNEPETN